jgi:dienelactone hydrolase
VSVGDPPLSGTLTLPARSGRYPAVVLVSGSGPNDQDETVGADKPFRDIADGLADHGIASIRYDKRTKDYPGAIDLATFTPTEEYVPDAVAAVHLLQRRSDIDSSRIFVLGHSQGGTFAPKIAHTDPNVAGIILLAASTESIGSALVRQLTYLSSLPGAVGQQARANLPEAEQAAQQIDNPDLSVANRSTWPTSPLLGGASAAYFLDLRSYNPVATARAIPQSILILQGGRDYQVTVANDLSRWEQGLTGRRGVTVHVYADDDHLFIKGSGPSSPADYEKPKHVDPQVISTIAEWIDSH